jgi:hypothetical protein
MSHRIGLFIVYFLPEKGAVECTFATCFKIVYEGGAYRSRYLNKIFFLRCLNYFFHIIIIQKNTFSYIFHNNRLFHDFARIGRQIELA